MLSVFLFVLGSATITLQETTSGASFTTRETDPTSYTTVELASTGETFPTIQTTLNVPASKIRNGGSACKNEFLCTLQRKSTFSKGFPPVPSKNLVPPFTDSEEELRTTEVPSTTFNEAETESVLPTTLILRATSIRGVNHPGVLQKRDNPVGREKSRPEATNELRSYLPPAKLSPSAAQVDLSYLPPKGVLPAAASLDIAKVNYLPPFEESSAAAQAPARQVKPVQPEVARKDICSDAFHSFLCAPLRSRKRITGALPNSLLPNEFIRSSFNPAASNTVQNSVSTAKPSTVVSSTAKTTYLPRSTTTTPGYSPEPSNIDRSYLPPVANPFAASPSLNSVTIAKANDLPKITTRKPPSTSTARPFIHTSIIPFISPKVIEQINLSPLTAQTKTTTTTTATTTVRPKTTTTPFVRLAPEPSNEINRGYLPPAKTRQPVIQRESALPTFQQRAKSPAVQIVTESTRRFVTTTPRYTPASSNADRNYLPPAQKLESAAAAQVNQAVSAPAAEAAHDHHDHHHHHGKDICSDPFHSFLCAPLKQRKRITGALPPGFNPQSSNRQETKVKPQVTLKPENTFQSESRIKPSEEVASANALAPQSVGYQYPKPTVSFPLPSQTSTERVRPTTARPTTGYQYPRPSNPLPLPLPSQQNVEIVPKEDRVSPTIVTPRGYQYPKPAIPFPLPSEEGQQNLPTAYIRSSIPRLSTPAPVFLPSQQKIVVTTTTPKPLEPQPSDQRVGYQYPKPEQSLPLPAGYRYPKPANQLVLPTERKSGLLAVSPLKPTLASLTDLGSAEFIPVNKIDTKRQVPAGNAGSPRFGERIRGRVRQQGIARTL